MTAIRRETAAFWRGFRAGAPLWLAAAPFAIAYSIAARQAGLGLWEAQLMSLTVYSAATQIALAQLMPGGAPALTLLLTVCLMNIHHILYGLSLSRQIRLRPLERAAAAFALTDFAYGATIAQPQNNTLPFLLGVELSIFTAWNLYTAFALLIGTFLNNLKGLHLDFIVPLMFFLLLITQIKRRTGLLVAVFSAFIALLCSSLGLGGLSVIVAGTGGPLLGLAWGRSRAAR